MGEIVAFRAPKRRCHVAPSGGAKISFISSVRYQRGIEDAPSSLPEPRSPQQDGGRGGVGRGKLRRSG